MFFLKCSILKTTSITKSEASTRPKSSAGHSKANYDAHEYHAWTYMYINYAGYNIKQVLEVGSVTSEDQAWNKQHARRCRQRKRCTKR